MTLAKNPPDTDQLLTQAAKSTGVRYHVEVKGNVLELVLQIDRVLIYRGDEPTPIAVLRFGGPHSGAMWLNNQLIGEYDKDREGKFVVTEIESGFKRPNSRRHEDPVVHIIRQLQPA